MFDCACLDPKLVLALILINSRSAYVYLVCRFEGIFAVCLLYGFLYSALESNLILLVYGSARTCELLLDFFLEFSQSLALVINIKLGETTRCHLNNIFGKFYLVVRG